MYDGLTPLFNRVGPGGPPQVLQVRGARAPAGQGPLRNEPVPGARREDHARQLQRAAHQGATNDDVTFGAGWVIAKDRGLLLEQARYNSRVAAVDAPGLDALGLIATCATSRPPRRPSARSQSRRGALQAGRRQGPRGAARHRRVHRGHQRLLPRQQQPGEAVDAQRHLCAQRAQGPVRRPGRRRRGPQRDVPRRPARPPRARARASRSGTTCASARTPRPPCRSTGASRTPAARRRSGNVVLDNGSFKAAAGGVQRRGGRAQRNRQASNILMVDRAPLDHRQAADGRRPADRLLLPRPHAGDGPQGPGLAGARRHVGAVPRLHPDRPRRGLRVDAHLGRRRHHRPLRRDACAAAAASATSTRAGAGG